ncbi:S9 family peptidase [Henriciella litoralis]|uniref:S9 family peptidase n=1 Tax=Henriciella litoralis TaxID=568102 RepID=UPI001F38542B|nr:S9 family peptidase [Henriciella litoralis]
MTHKFSAIAAVILAMAGLSLTQAPAHARQEGNAMPSQELTIERLYASPSLNGPSPTGVKYSPDGQRVTFLKARESDSSRYDLWQFDVATGAQSMLVDSLLLEPETVELSEEEKALRERKRIAGRKGIVDYDWGTADTILVPLGGDLHLVTLGEDGPTTRQLTETEAFEYDAKVSPKGNYVSFVRDGAVFVIDLASGEETQITPDAEPDNAISYGVAEFVAQEEMSRYTGYWWSPDERQIAYTRVDESPVDVIERFDIAADKTTVIDQRYPRAGRPNAVVDLFVRDLDSDRVAKLSTVGPDDYLARVNWAGRSLWFQTVNRDQTEIRYNRTDGLPWRVWSPLKETQDHWVNLSNDFSPFEDGILLTSEQSGFRHIYISPDGSDADQLVPVTEGDWAVDAIKAYQGDTRMVYFTGFMTSPLEKHLYRVSIDGGEPVRLTETGKSWAVTMAPDGKSYVGTSSSPTQPPQTGLYRLTEPFTEADVPPVGALLTSDPWCYDLEPASARASVECKPKTELIAWIEENALDESHPYFPYLADHTVPEYGALEAEDGQPLYYSMQAPPGFSRRSDKKYPVIIEVYGGPHVQTVDRDWESLSDQYLTRQGYIVFRLDNRGMANRGKRFEDAIYRQTGGPEVRDQLVGVDWLKAQPFVDPDRIAIQGWSYGGYMTLMTILQAPEGTFAAAASGAPVTDWSLYDTFYTERYMDTPQDNPDGYEKSSVFYHLDRLETALPPLLMMHGMADDNVTFDNSTRLYAAMQEKGLMFDMMTYPGQRHGIRGQALQTHLMKTRMAFLNRHLKPGQ